MKDIIWKKDSPFDAARHDEDWAKKHARYSLLQPDEPKRILVKGAAFVITIDKEGVLQVWPKRSIYIAGGKIREIFPAGKETVPEGKVDLVYDASKRGGIVVTPGFINAHAHPPMYLLRSSMTLNKGDIREQVAAMAAMEREMTDEDFYLGAVGDFTEEQKSGITTTFSHYATFHPIDRAAETTRQNVINAVSAVSNSHPENSLEMAEKILERRDEYFSQPAIAIHYLHKADPDQLQGIRKLIQKYKVLFTLHVAENEEWVQECVAKYGKRTIETLADMGLAGPDTIISHGVHLSDDEIKLIRKHKIGVVHLPTSNRLHKSGDMRYLDFIKYGADSRICLGTDSVVSKNSLDLLSEALQTRITHIDKHRILYEDLFALMTSQAAKILKLGRVGKILPGYAADLAFWKLKDRGFVPFSKYEPVSLVGNMITHGGRNIRDLMIGGKFIISNRTHNLVDESKLLAKLQKAHMRLRRRVKK